MVSAVQRTYKGLVSGASFSFWDFRTDLSDTNVGAVRVYVWIVSKQSAHVDSCNVGDRGAEVAFSNDMDSLAVLASDAQADGLDGGSVSY